MRSTTKKSPRKMTCHNLRVNRAQFLFLNVERKASQLEHNIYTCISSL